jgi:hypothetical protein
VGADLLTAAQDHAGLDGSGRPDQIVVASMRRSVFNMVHD